MTDARARLAELEEDRAARVREVEAAEGRLESYKAGAGSLAVDGRRNRCRARASERFSRY